MWQKDCGCAGIYTKRRRGSLCYAVLESQKENREWLHSYSYEIVTEEVMKAMADTKTPQGVLAVARQKKYTLEELLKPASSGTPLLLMLLENIQDPGNLGRSFGPERGQSNRCDHEP